LQSLLKRLTIDDSDLSNAVGIIERDATIGGVFWGAGIQFGF
jgi:hypothetical protein